MFGIRRIDVDVGRTTTARYQIVLCRVDRNAIEPGIKGALTPETRQRAIGFDECFLDDVVDLVVRAHVTTDESVDLVLVAAKQ